MAESGKLCGVTRDGSGARRARGGRFVDRAIGNRRRRLLRRVRAAALMLAAAMLIAGALVALVLIGGAITAIDLAVVGGGSVVVLLALAAVAGVLVARVPRNAVLELNLTEPLRREGDRSPARFGRPTTRDVVEALDRAARDRHVAGLVARLGTPLRGLGDAQELRDAVERFRAAGKFAIAHADTFGELSAGNAAYYLASGFDEIVLQPSGDVGLVGVAAEMNFVREALDRLGVSVQVERRWEYKTAAEPLTERGLSAAARESMGRLVESQFEQLVAGVAERRGLTPEHVRAVVDAGPVLGSEAREAGLVDALGYRHDALERARERAHGGPLLALSGYRPRRQRRGAAVAVIDCSGVIIRGRRRGLAARGTVGAETLAAAVRDAAADRKVRAIVLRIDSPGGSYVGSDTVWREIVRARDNGTPVVASMGNVAASGGYFLAAAADRIVAHGATVTGSIGVIGAKAVVSGLKQKLGIDTDDVHVGANALIASPSHPWDEAQRRLVRRWLDRAYEDFTGKVAQGRELPPERIDDVARGRVWTGADAAERGLVDALGGYHTALAEARALIGVGPDAPLRLVRFPRRQPVLALLRGESELERACAEVIDGVFALAVPLIGGLRWPVPEAGVVALVEEHLQEQ
jgi:protease-4